MPELGRTAHSDTLFTKQEQVFTEPLIGLFGNVGSRIVRCLFKLIVSSKCPPTGLTLYAILKPVRCCHVILHLLHLL